MVFVAAACDVIVVAVKPGVVGDALRALAPAANGKLVVSIAAGVTIAAIEAALADAEPPKKKVSASPNAQQFARDNGIDIDTVTGTGENAKILLKDVKALVTSPSEAGPSDDTVKISPSAAKLMKQHGWDEDDVSHIQGSGKNGALLAGDLAEMVKETLEEEGSETDASSDED